MSFLDALIDRSRAFQRKRVDRPTTENSVEVFHGTSEFASEAMSEMPY